jgi:hypothetical protein
MYAKYINSYDSTPCGLGVMIPGEELLEYVPRVENPLSQKDDGLHTKPAGQQETSSQCPRSKLQQTLTKTMLDTYALMRGRLGRGDLGPLYRKGFFYRPWQLKPEDNDPKLSPIIPWGTL